MTAAQIQDIQDTFEECCRHCYMGTGRIEEAFDFDFETEDYTVEIHGEAMGFVEDYPGTYFDPPYTTGYVYFEPSKVIAVGDEHTENITDKIKTFKNNY